LDNKWPKQSGKNLFLLGRQEDCSAVAQRFSLADFKQWVFIDKAPVNSRRSVRFFHETKRWQQIVNIEEYI
jgi:siroheme synthase (precorrin-2 oxidase/ferrochelatase)